MATPETNISSRLPPQPTGCLSSPRWIVCLFLAVIVLLYFFSNITVSLVNQRRWERPSGPPANNKYEDEFNSRVVAPFRSLLDKLANKLNVGESGKEPVYQRNLSAILPPRVQLTDSQTMALIEGERSNLAAIYFDRWSKSGFGNDAIKYGAIQYCPRVKMISPHKVRMNNLMWQVVQTKDGPMGPTSYLLNAYYDDRIWGKPTVKSIWVTDRQVPVMKKKWWCLLWFDNLADPIISKV